jgi:hypothetical protein
MNIDRIWAMPNKWTFTIKPIRELIAQEWTKGVWVDPFAGENSPAQITNDLNPVRPTTHHMDALEFLKSLPNESADGVLFDPPYSITQAKQCYDEFGADKLDVSVTSMQYWGDCKTEICRILKPGGKVLCFGWNSMGVGINRGFEMSRVLIVPHGGSKNDTICTVEVKKQRQKDNEVALPLAA